MKVKTHQRQILHLDTRINLPKPQSDGAGAIKTMLKRLKDDKTIEIGINSINRKMIQGKIKLLVIAADVNPPEIIQHLLIMASSSKIPIITTNISQKEMGTCLNCRSACVAGITNNAQKDLLDVLSPFTSIIEPGPLQALRIETDVFIPKKK